MEMDITSKVNMEENMQLKLLISQLKATASKEKSELWNRIAEDLAKSTRQRRVVNISKLNRVTKANEVVIVPGKVLGDGDLDHKLTVAAFTFSKNAVEKMKKQNCECITIQNLIKKNPKAKDVRIVG